MTRAGTVVVAAAAALAVACVMVPLRASLLNADVELVLVVVVVVAAVVGGLEAGVGSAVAAAFGFDFLHTKPYLQLTIDRRDDVITTLLLLVVGLVVGTVAARGRRARSHAERRRGAIQCIHRVAELAARGEDVADVVMTAQAELTGLLDLRTCRFEAAPFPADANLESLERSGAVSWRAYRLHEGGLELPTAGLELPVLGRGQLLGRFVLGPTPGVGVSLEQRVVAVAIADQVGAALAAPHTVGEGRDG
jgi:hypothetical protein